MAAKFLKFATFPWVALTPTDRHVLSSTDEFVFSCVFFEDFFVKNSFQLIILLHTVRLSVRKCIVAKQYVLQQDCLNK